MAPHSVRAVPREWLTALAGIRSDMPVHMHVAEQPKEIEACVAEHGLRPVELLEALGLLEPRFTAVHAVHVTDEEARMLGDLRVGVCACPSTERNLGDGIIPADELAAAGAWLCLGSDSQASAILCPMGVLGPLHRPGTRLGRLPSAALRGPPLQPSPSTGLPFFLCSPG